MEQPGKLGRCEAPAGWETLCCDVRELILRKLAMRDLARAATVCRALRGAYVSRLAEERASLIAVGEEAFGKGVFSTFTTALRRIILGLSPFPNLVCKGEDSSVQEQFLFTNAAEPAWTHGHVTSKMLKSYQPCGVFIYPDADSSFLFYAILHHGCGATCCYSGAVHLTLSRESENKLRMEVWVDSEAAAEAVGPLVASCLETPSGLPPSCPRPLVIDFCMHEDGGASAEEVEDLCAPLRSLVESVNISWE